MIPLTLDQVAEVVGGTVVRGGETLITGPAVVDSRKAVPGALFVAVVGEHSDGHDHAAAAAGAGAVATLGTREVPGPCLIVEEPLAAVTALASWMVRELRRSGPLTVVALTGSQGKTSVKDLLAHVLESQGPTVAAEGSFNNELGVPLTILRANAQTRWLVLEMGARGIGHVAALCAIAVPDVAAVLNVGTAHLGEFGSVAVIAQAKGEIVEALNPAGIAVLNGDDPRVAAMRTRTAATVIGFGHDAEVSITEPVTLDERGHARVTLRYAGLDWPITVPQVGFHHGINAAAAFAISCGAGVEPEAIASALGAATARSAMRMQRHEAANGIVILNDAYNANPESMTAALATLVAVAPGRTVAVLGAMLELGPESGDQHRRVGRTAAELGVNLVIVVGEEAGGLADGAGDRAVLVESVDEAIDALRGRLCEGDTVLVKASRSVKLEKIVESLTA